MCSFHCLITLYSLNQTLKLQHGGKNCLTCVSVITSIKRNGKLLMFVTFKMIKITFGINRMCASSSDSNSATQAHQRRWYNTTANAAADVRCQLQSAENTKQHCRGAGPNVNKWAASRCRDTGPVTQRANTWIIINHSAYHSSISLARCWKTQMLILVTGNWSGIWVESRAT